MPKYIEAVKAAEIIAERTKCNMVYLVDWFCEIASEDAAKGYDAVEGGVANDQVIDTVEDYEMGRITAN